MNANTLYGLTEQLIQQIDIDADDYEKLEKMRLGKFDSCLGYLNAKKDMINTIDSHIKRLQDLKKKEEKRLQNFEKYVIQNMNRLGRKKMQTVFGTISVFESQQVHIYDESLIPDSYMNIKTVKTPNKILIKDALKAGQVPGAIIQVNQNLRIQ